MPRQPSLVFRSLEPLIRALWPIFLGCTAFVTILWWAGDSWLNHITNPGLKAALAFIVRSADAAWLLLGALNLYLELAAREGIARARSVALVVFGAAIAAAWASVITGHPLGHVVYTGQLGARIGPVPLGWLLLWFVVVPGARAFLVHFWPRLSHTAISAATGLVALLTDLNLEPLAVKLRLYWFWYVDGTTTPASPPWSNYVTWFLLATALAWFAREQKIATARTDNLRGPWVIMIVNGVFLLGHLRSLIAR